MCEVVSGRERRSAVMLSAERSKAGIEWFGSVKESFYKVSRALQWTTPPERWDAERMKVFVFKPTNEPIGKFEVDKLEIPRIEAGLEVFAQTHPVQPFDYLESGARRTWTVIDDPSGLRVKEGRLRPEPTPIVVDAEESLEQRYRQRYRRAQFVITSGSVLKVLAVLIAIAVLLVSLVTNQRGIGMSPVIGVLGAFMAAATAGVPVFIAGIVVGVLGDIHQATLDSAVHGSPHLEEEEKARLLGVG